MKKLVLKRKPFRRTIMGIPIYVYFDHEYCVENEIYGRAFIHKGDIVLAPNISDNLLLDTFAHEVLEILDSRMEWKLSHVILSQLGVLIANLVEIGVE